MDHHVHNVEQAFIVLVEQQLHAYHVQLEHLVVMLVQDLAQLVHHQLLQRAQQQALPVNQVILIQVQTVFKYLVQQVNM